MKELKFILPILPIIIVAALIIGIVLRKEPSKTTELTPAIVAVDSLRNDIIAEIKFHEIILHTSQKANIATEMVELELNNYCEILDRLDTIDSLLNVVIE